MSHEAYPDAGYDSSQYCTVSIIGSRPNQRILFDFITTDLYRLVSVIAVSCKDAKKDVDAVKDGVENVVDGVKDAAEKTADAVEEGAETVKDSIASKAADAKKAIKDGAKEVVEEGSKIVKDAVKEIK